MGKNKRNSMRPYYFFITVLKSALARSRPNVILLICDDFGIGDFQVYNKNSKVPTPNIDRLGNEGVKFVDGHAGSSRCAPSRYMLMSGRYSLEDSPSRRLDQGTPQLADMFKREGYQTALFGKFQPLDWKLENMNQTAEMAEQQRINYAEYNKKMYGGSSLSKNHKQWIPRGSFHDLGEYHMTTSPNDHNYDYSFTSSSMCCQPGGWYENGIGIEPVSAYAIQRPYPEGSSKETSVDPVTGKCNEHPVTGYFGPPYFDRRVEGPYLHCNFPLSQVTMPSYDFRLIDDAIVPKVTNFIQKNAKSEDPFFIYYGMRSGHRPFNTPERFRGKSKAGLVGEMILEADEIVGRIMSELETQGIADDTLIVFMSDNGADGSAFYAKQDFGHLQHGLDINGKTVELRGGKNHNYEAGHRVPFLWRYPNGWTPKVVDNPSMPVSYLDVYKTLADLIGTKTECNEAPDSRSLMTLLKGEEPSLKLRYSKIFTHAKKGATIAFRQRHWKWIPQNLELFNLQNDIEETKNVYQDNKEWAHRINDTMNSMLEKMNEREEITQKGKIQLC